MYLSEHLSLAVIEVLVHASSGTLPEHVAFAMDVPDDVTVYSPKRSELPSVWRSSEAPVATQRFGDAWLDRGDEALMRVPSVIIPEELNYLLNPEHPDAARLVRHAPVRFSFDPRLFKS